MHKFQPIFRNLSPHIIAYYVNGRLIVKCDNVTELVALLTISHNLIGLNLSLHSETILVSAMIKLVNLAYILEIVAY